MHTPRKIDFSASRLMDEYESEEMSIIVLTMFGPDIVKPLVFAEAENGKTATVFHVNEATPLQRIPKLIVAIPALCGHWDCGDMSVTVMN